MRRCSSKRLIKVHSNAICKSNDKSCLVARLTREDNAFGKIDGIDAEECGHRKGCCACGQRNKDKMQNIVKEKPRQWLTRSNRRRVKNGGIKRHVKDAKLKRILARMHTFTDFQYNRNEITDEKRKW